MLGVWRLQLLREVSRRGTIRAAATAMSITPSAVSQQLRILEAEAGVPLLERHGRLVRLTDAGEMLVRHADTITAAITAAESELAASQREIAGTLRVAAIPTAAARSCPRRSPRSAGPTRGCASCSGPRDGREPPGPRADEVDLAVVDEYDEATRIREPGIELLDLLAEPILVALPPGHAAGPGPVPLAALGDEDVDHGHGGQRDLPGAGPGLRRAGFEPHVRSNCRDYSVIIALVEAGSGSRCSRASPCGTARSARGWRRWTRRWSGGCGSRSSPSGAGTRPSPRCWPSFSVPPRPAGRATGRRRPRAGEAADQGLFRQTEQ